MVEWEGTHLCGIVGLIDTVAGEVPLSLLETMRDVMISRGPDGKGHYLEGALGMAVRRLSIIDLLEGAQPFFSSAGQVVAFQNGEIYNYRDLRSQLIESGYGFISQSDTEVLAHGFVEWGAEGLLERVDGMYAIAILDRRSRTLHLARDRFGEKPLFYANSDGRFAYSSNLVVLASLPWVSDEIDFRSLECYLALHYVAGEATIMKSVRRVLPGEHVTVDIDNPIPKRRRYYSLPLGSEKDTSIRDLTDLVVEAVESRLVADVPVGIFLSGGLDSSLMAAIAAKKSSAISTFSMGFSEATHDEGPHAEKVAQAIGSQHHQFLFDDRSFCSLLPKVASAMDEPIGDQALLPLYWLCKEARQRITVALSGEGADEVFGGYDYYRSCVEGVNRRSKLKAWLGLAPLEDNYSRNLIHYSEPVSPSGFPLLTDNALRQSLTAITFSNLGQWESKLFRSLNNATDGLQRATAVDLATWLPDDLLVKFDRMSMAHSLEGRAPYLSPGLVKAGLALPSARRIEGTTSKLALRQVAEKWLPREIIDRPKQGFVLPMARWLEQWFQAHRSVRDYFYARPFPGLRMNAVAQLVQEDLAVGIQRERLLFALVMLVEWYQFFKDKREMIARRYREALAVHHKSVLT